MRPFISPRRAKGLITILALSICLDVAFARPSDVVSASASGKINGPDPTVEPFKATAVLVAPKEDGNITVDKVATSYKRYINLSSYKTFVNPRLYMNGVEYEINPLKIENKTKKETIEIRKPISTERINNNNELIDNISKPYKSFVEYTRNIIKSASKQQKTNKISAFERFIRNTKPNNRLRRETHYSFGIRPYSFRQINFNLPALNRRLDSKIGSDDSFYPISRNVRKSSQVYKATNTNYTKPKQHKKSHIIKINTADHYETINSDLINSNINQEVVKKNNISIQPKNGFDHSNALKKWKNRLKPLPNDNVSSVKPTSYSSLFSNISMSGTKNITFKKTPIQQIYTKWLEKSNFEDILNVNDKVSSSYNTFNNKPLFNDLPQSNVDKIHINDVVYIRPKPFFGLNKNNTYNVAKPSVPSGIIVVDRFDKHTTLLPSPSPVITYAGWPESNNIPPKPTTIIKTAENNIHSTQQKIVTPKPYYDFTNPIPTTPIYDTQDPDRPDPPSYNEDKYQINGVTSDCPTVYITLNNTISQAKEACPDYNIVINSHLINKNIIKDDHSDSTVEESSENEGILGPYGVGIKSEEVPDESIEPESPNLSSGYIPVGSTNYQQVTNVNYGQSSQGGGIGPPAANPGALRPPAKPTRKPKPAQESEDDSNSVSSWLNSIASFATWTTLLNPFGFGFWPVLISPLLILFAGGVGFATIFAPWAFPAVLDRKAKTVFRIHEQPTKWQWDSGHKTWNWASFPNDRDWKEFDPRSGPNYGVPVETLKIILTSAYDFVADWIKKPSHRNKGRFSIDRFFYESIVNIASSFDSWKKRRR